MRESSERLGRIIGLLLLVQFTVALVFNVALLGPVISQPPGWIVNAAAEPLAVSMSVLLALVADAIWLAIAVIAYPLFARASLRTAVAFVALTSVALALSAVENSQLLTLRSLSQAYAVAGTADRELFETLRVLFGSARNWAHYTHLMVTGISILAFFVALFRFFLVPRALALHSESPPPSLQITAVDDADIRATGRFPDARADRSCNRFARHLATRQGPRRAATSRPRFPGWRKAMRTVQQQARHAGVLYFVMGLIAPIGLLVVPDAIVVSGDATATAENIRESGELLRLGIATDLVHQVIAIFMVLALYRLFKPVSVTLARQLVVLGALVSVPIVFFNTLNYLAALSLTSGADFLSVFGQPELDALAYLFMRLHARGLTVASVFWGLWLFPFGLLAIRSGFIPPVFGYLLFVAGFGYLASATSILVLPELSPFVSKFAMLLYTCEVPIIFWLLIRGARGPAAAMPASTA